MNVVVGVVLGVSVDTGGCGIRCARPGGGGCCDSGYALAAVTVNLVFGIDG